MSGFGSRPTAAPIPVDANRRALADALLGFPARVGQAFTGMANAGLQANEAFLQGRGTDGEDLYARPLLPGADTGGRLGALASFVGSNMAMGGPAGSLGAGPSLARTANALPMDEASRMARAANMFPIEALHGRSGDYERVRIPYSSGNNTDVGSVGRGFYAAPNDAIGANTASTYAEMADIRHGLGANVMPVRMSIKNPLVINAPRKDAVEKLSREWGLVDTPDYSGSRPTNGFWASDFASELQKRGYDGVIVRDGDRVLEYMVPNENQVRSRFAAFDPARRNEADLLASFAPNPIAGALLGYQPQE